MLFNSFSFVFFFALIWGLVGLLNHAGTLRWRNVLLLMASLFFYACFRWDFLIWLMAVIAVNYAGGLWLTHSKRHARKKLAVIIILSLLPLLLFKYSRFLAGNLAAWFRCPEILPERFATLVLPAGLSFFTFQALTYSIDLYRKRMPVERNIIDFALAVSFFPTILSGPITRSRDFLPQLKAPLPMSMDAFASGLQQFVWGLFKKCVVADRLAGYVDAVYVMPEACSGKSIALAAICYSIQIYCDFSGYSDMAIGSARALGFSLRKNFDFPYFSTGVRDFWRRWHISLTGWFTEYLYISCGGNRVTRMRWIRNILLVFLASGLWHGANWTYLVWGGVHGGLYLGEVALTRGRKASPESCVGKALAGIVTFAAVSAAWIFFRSPDVCTALLLLQRLIGAWGGQLYTGASSFSFAVMLAVSLFAILVEWGASRRKVAWDDGKALSWTRMTFSMVLLLGVELLAVPSTQFVYCLF